METEALIEPLVRTVHKYLNMALDFSVGDRILINSWPPAEGEWNWVFLYTVDEGLRLALKKWKEKKGKCDLKKKEHLICSPCLVTKHRGPHGYDDEDREQRCVSTSVGKLLNELTVDQLDNLCELFVRAFFKSVCTFTRDLDLGEDLRTITPPWGELGLGDSLRDCSFTKANYSSHLALGTLADHLVRRGLFAAATAGGEDHWTQGEADQQTKSVGTKAE